jgi:hypothetical protein
MSIVEQRTYVLKPEFGPADYFALYEKAGRQVQFETLQGFLAYFTSEVGELNAVVSLWSYPSFEARLERRGALAANPVWQEFLREVRPMLQRMENRLLIPTSFSKLS